MMQSWVNYLDALRTENDDEIDLLRGVLRTGIQ